jgi:hypothetical protein
MPETLVPPVAPSPPGPAAPPTPAALLEQAAAEFTKGERCHRRHPLEAAGLAQAFLLAARAQGQPRDQAVKAIAARLAEVAGQARTHKTTNALLLALKHEGGAW